MPTLEGPDRGGRREGFAVTAWARELRPELGRAEGQARPLTLVSCSPACPRRAARLHVVVPGACQRCAAGPGGPPCHGDGRAGGPHPPTSCQEVGRHPRRRRGAEGSAACPWPPAGAWRRRDPSLLPGSSPRRFLPWARERGRSPDGAGRWGGGRGRAPRCRVSYTNNRALEQFYFYFLFLLPCWLFLAAGVDRPPPSSLHLASWPRPGPSVRARVCDPGGEGTWQLGLHTPGDGELTPHLGHSVGRPFLTPWDQPWGAGGGSGCALVGDLVSSHASGSRLEGEVWVVMPACGCGCMPWAGWATARG